MLRAQLKLWNMYWFRGKIHWRAASSVAKRRRFPLNVEILEDRVTPSGLQFQAVTLSADTAGANYSTTFQAAGGDGHYSYSISSGALPSGFSLNSTSGV